MPIFQKSVIQKYLKGLNTIWLNTAYDKFNEIFNKQKIERIKNFKEEEYQDGFLRDLFVEVLGYTLKTDDENFNLVREFKNQTDGKKADGAIIKDEKAIAVIELKSIKTKDLTSVTQQAFNYKNNQPGCKYVITSNFQKLRFYVDYANEYEEFDLFNLQKSDFELLYLILREKSIFSDTPQKLKDETRFHEEKISKQLYEDYSNFKNNIFENLVKNNPEIDKLKLFKKSQKLLDRLLFIFFAEDCGLLPPNSISRIIERFEILKREDTYRPLYEIYKQYFGYMNIGRKGKTPADDIPAYNGGLFATDDFLDNLKIDDKVLKNDCLKLSAYDFNTEVDVNILGQIFEHSLNEIEEMERNLSKKDGVSDDKISKRKKDGVFYTPKYITQYIVENTIGTLCTEKRKEMNIYEIEFDTTYKTKKGILNKKGKLLFDKLNNYKKWLLSLKILDPACGSGAFLNQALIFLINEHKQIDNFISELTGDKIGLFDTDKAILENNIYGVDINEESVEIAKLSLWLRTAQKGRHLSDLSSNIKCGNSLIDDQKIAKEKVFKWNEEFKEIFDAGGFDVIIGNPPYGAKLSNKTKKYLSNEFPELQFKIDTYSVFLLKSINLVKTNGLIYSIIPNTLLDNYFEEKVREKLLFSNQIIEIIDLDDKVFSDAVVHSMIFGFRKLQIENYEISIRSSKNISSKQHIIPCEYFKTQEKYLFSIRNYKVKDFLTKISENSITLKQIIDIRQAIKTGNDNIYISEKQEDDNFKPVLGGKHIQKWSIIPSNLFVNYGKHLACPRNYKIFEQAKILIREAGNKITATYDENNYYILSSLYNAILINDNYNLKFILSLINSKLFQYQLKLIAFDKTKGAFTKARIFHYYELPIKILQLKKQQPFVKKADLMLLLNDKLQIKSQKFIKRIKSNTELEKLSNKLKKFYDFDFKTFISELKKKKIKLTFKEQDEWEDYFESYKTEINNLQIQINQTDNEIDKLVYELYELTDKEIKIIENELN